MSKSEPIFLKAEDVTPNDQAGSIGYKTYLKTKRSFPKKRSRKPDNYPDDIVIDRKRLERHDAGAAVIDPTKMRSVFHQEKFQKQKKKLMDRAEKTVRAEILNKEEDGFLQPDDGEFSYNIRQKEIAESVDLAGSAKYFELNLEQFGPYRISYTDNGRHLLIGGHKGHIASFDWQTKNLYNESNCMEVVRDVAWLHTQNIYAVAQKNYTYVYDNMGTELHCLKTLAAAKSLQFLPRHFLLVAGSKNSWLNFLDVSIGKMVSSFCTKKGPLDVMCQNPANAIIHTGHANGTVCLWSPNANEPLVRLLAHPSSVKGVAVDETGTYMYTTGLDRKCRVWDVRMFKQMYSYTLPFGLSTLAVSQKKFVACAVGNTVQVFNDMHLGTCREPYLTHRCSGTVSDLEFVPFEDVLGVGHAGGFTSMLVPGAGEANVDSLRCNPYETKSQRKEREIKQLLDKLQPDLISLDPDDICRVNESLLEEAMEERKKILYVRPLAVEYTPRHKMRGRASGKHKEDRKQVVKEGIRVTQNKEREEMEREVFGRGQKESRPDRSVLDRFRR